MCFNIILPSLSLSSMQSLLVALIQPNIISLYKNQKRQQVSSRGLGMPSNIHKTVSNVGEAVSNAERYVADSF